MVHNSPYIQHEMDERALPGNLSRVSQGEQATGCLRNENIPVDAFVLR